MTDEYFYGLENQLLTDQGNPELSPGSLLVEDDYVWLGGRPVLLIRDNYDVSTGELASPLQCGRNGEDGECGAYAIVTDHIGAPIAMFNAEEILSGYASYDPFGHINRLETTVATAHPYPNKQANVLLESREVPVGTSDRVDFRVRMHIMEMSDLDHANLASDGMSGSDITTPSGVQGRVNSEWLTNTDGTIELRFSSNSSGTNSYGVNAEFYEYRKHGDTMPMFTPLRFPGQYFDEESDLSNNWNRYYDPTIGAYYQPEPMLQAPKFVSTVAEAGHSTSSYAYARNNPVANLDPNGLFVIKGGSAAQRAALRKAIDDLRRRVKEQNECGCELKSQSKDWEADFVEGQGPTISIETGLETAYTDWSGNIHMRGDARWLTENHVLHEYAHSAQIRNYGAWNTMWLGRRAQEANAVGAEQKCLGRSFGGTAWKDAWQLPVGP